MKAIEPYKRVISHGGQWQYFTHIHTVILSVSMNKLYRICVWHELISLFIQNVLTMKIVFWYWNINSSCLIFHCRLLWRRFECHNCVRCVLYAWEQSTKLQIHHGQFIQVSVYLISSGLVSEHFRTGVNGPVSCRYVIGTLELLVAENYMIVYLNGATSRKKMPAVGWLRKCYQQIDRRWVRLAPDN